MNRTFKLRSSRSARSKRAVSKRLSRKSSRTRCAVRALFALVLQRDFRFNDFLPRVDWCLHEYLSREAFAQTAAALCANSDLGVGGETDGGGAEKRPAAKEQATKEHKSVCLFPLRASGVRRQPRPLRSRRRREGAAARLCRRGPCLGGDAQRAFEKTRRKPRPSELPVGGGLGRSPLRSAFAAAFVERPEHFRSGASHAARNRTAETQEGDGSNSVFKVKTVFARLGCESDSARSAASSLVRGKGAD